MQKKLNNLPKNTKFLMAEAAIVLALIVFIIISRAGGSAKDVPIGEIKAQMDAQPYVSLLLEGSSNDIQELFALDISAYDEAYYRMSESGLDARQILIIKCSNEDTRDVAYEKISEYNETQMKVFRDYAPEQYNLLKNADLWTRGNYVFYAVSEHADEWEEAFKSLIR